MLRMIPVVSVIVIFTAGLLAGCSKEVPKKVESGQTAASLDKPGMSPSGKAMFKQYCSSCHPDGGNVSDPSLPLYGSALKRNHITKPEDIVRIMRNPLSRMIRFDVSTLSDKDARAIAEYVLATFR
jgi:cytochrome c6